MINLGIQGIILCMMVLPIGFGVLVAARRALARERRAVHWLAQQR